jgi:hypothetical protein
MKTEQFAFVQPGRIPLRICKELRKQKMKGLIHYKNIIQKVPTRQSQYFRRQSPENELRQRSLQLGDLNDPNVTFKPVNAVKDSFELTKSFCSSQSV